MDSKKIVIIGTSVAGVRTARALRGAGFGGQIVLVGKEIDLPYDKPPLSKQFLAGTWDQDRVTLLTAEAATEAGIDMRLGVAAEHLDIENRAVVLGDGARIPYDVVVIATGADARRWPSQAESGVHVLRSLQDSRHLASALVQPGPVVVVGGGFIGAEVASTVHSVGHPVTIADSSAAPLARLVGDEMGALLSDIHGRHGVNTRFAQGVKSISGRAGALEVALTNGETLPAATVVVGIGATPNDDWLSSSGLVIDDGVICDQFCRAVDQLDVFAVGDVARWYHPDHQERVRFEHWTNAAEQAACVAHNICHPDELRPYAPAEYVWSDQYGWKIQLAGRPNRGALQRIVGAFDASTPQAVAVYTDGSGTLLGAVTVNWPKAVMLCRQMIRARATMVEVNATLESLSRVNATSLSSR